MNSNKDFIDPAEISLICWLDWYDGPLSGLMRLRDEVCWFQYDDRWDDGGDWGYVYDVYRLNSAQLDEVYDWFEEKREWYAEKAPKLRKIAAELKEATLITKAREEQGFDLPEWEGPTFSEPAIARFSDKIFAAGWMDVDRWCLSDTDREGIYKTLESFT